MMISAFTESRSFTVRCADHGIQRGFNGSITTILSIGRAGIAIMSLQLGKAEKMKIIKKDYTVNPWRLVDKKGLEIPAYKTIQTDGGERVDYIATISGRTKAECTQKTLNLLENLYERLKNE